MYKFEVDETGTKFPILDWTNGTAESGCMEQAQNVANLPFIHKHVVLAPDAHQGFGMPIGGIVGLKGIVSPGMVGNDIGCGMRVLKTNLSTDQLNIQLLQDIRNELRGSIPMNNNAHKYEQSWAGFTEWVDELECIRGVYKYPEWYSNDILKWIRRSLGTLGGGNHFIELQKDAANNVYIMLHSGSRNLGQQVCKNYHGLALDMCNKWHVSLPDKHLAYLPVDSPEGQDYLRDMNFALAFAKENRSRLMDQVVDIVYNVLATVNAGPFKRLEEHDVHHNYAALENHMGKNVWVHRKGATSAKDCELGIIPGSQGTHSYIVKGLGNPLSFSSCSHGAGRIMGRKDAIRRLDLVKELEILDKCGVVHTMRGEKDLDEAPSAYKDISVVMKNQSDLVEVVTELSPIMVAKG